MASDTKYLKQTDVRGSGRITPVHRHFNRSLSGSFGQTKVSPARKTVSRSLSEHFTAVSSPDKKTFQRTASGQFGKNSSSNIGGSISRTSSSGSIGNGYFTRSLTSSGIFSTGFLRRSSLRNSNGRVTPINSRSPSPALSGTMIEVWTTDMPTVIDEHINESASAEDLTTCKLKMANGHVMNDYNGEIKTQVNGSISIDTKGPRNGYISQSSSPTKSHPPSPSDSLTRIWPISPGGGSDKDTELGFSTGNTVVCCAPETKVWKVILKLLFCILAGVIFGWCLEKSRVFEPESIRLQMVFDRWIMLKMFLGAMASGQLVLSILSLLPWTKDRFQRGLDAFCFPKTKGLLTSCVGPYILGTGMTLSGACPGMVLAQVGSWAKNSIYTLLGVLLGALVYGLLEKYIVKITKPRNPFTKHTIHQKLNCPYAAIALPLCLVVTTTVALMEVFINWEDDLAYYNTNDFDLSIRNTTDMTYNVFTMKSWPPSISGVIIGLLQVIIIFAATDTLGGSSSYVTLVSQWVVTEKLQNIFPYLAKARTGLANWWQVFYVGGAVLGGLFSALSSDSLATTKGSSVVTAFFGGILMLFGARLGSGCTSGHGLSGMGLLFWLSFVAVPCMFAGGIVTGFSMQATGELNHYHCHSDYQWMCTDS